MVFWSNLIMLIFTKMKPKSQLHLLDFAIANVQCQYDSPPEDGDERGRDGEGCGRDARVVAAIGDHTYDRTDEPPAFIIQQLHLGGKQAAGGVPYVEVTPRLVTLTTPGYLHTARATSLIHLGDTRPGVGVDAPAQAPECVINKRIRRSEQVLREAADCVSRGLTFQTVSERFNIPISTIRFFMARKGILPRRRRGRHGQLVRASRSPEPPFHMQHYKLPDMLALQHDDDTSTPPPPPATSS